MDDHFDGLSPALQTNVVGLDRPSRGIAIYQCLADVDVKALLESIGHVIAIVVTGDLDGGLRSRSEVFSARAAIVKIEYSKVRRMRFDARHEA